MGSNYLIIRVPSVDTSRKYRVGEDLTLQRRSHSGEQYYGTVVATGYDADPNHRSQQETGQTGEERHGLPLIDNRGDNVRRIVVDTRSTSSSKLRRLRPGYSISLSNDEGYGVRADIVHAYDVKQREQ
jgi:hypothetical protein